MAWFYDLMTFSHSCCVFSYLVNCLKVKGSEIALKRLVGKGSLYLISQLCGINFMALFFFCSRNLVHASKFVPKIKTEIALMRAYYLKKKKDMLKAKN